MRGAVTAVASPPGTGKTALSMQLAVAVGLDLPLATWEPQPGGGGRVAIFNGEEPTDELSRRFLAACYEAGVDPVAASRRVAYRSSQDAPLRLCKLDPYGAFQRSPDVDRLKAAIIEQDVKLVMLDPLIEFYDGIDESDNSQIKLVGQILREIAMDCDCAVMIFHHTKKSDNADTAAGDMNAVRFFDSDNFYYQKYQELKLRDLASKTSVPPPTPTNPTSPVLQTQEGAPVVLNNSGKPVRIPTFEGSSGVPSTPSENSNWQSTYNRLYADFKQNPSDATALALMRHKFKAEQ